MCENVDSTMFMYDSDNSKTRKMCDKAVEKKSKDVKFVADYFKLNKCAKKTDKKLLLAIKDVLDQHHIQQMCEKVISKNPEIL